MQNIFIRHIKMYAMDLMRNFTRCSKKIATIILLIRTAMTSEEGSEGYFSTEENRMKNRIWIFGLISARLVEMHLLTRICQSSKNERIFLLLKSKNIGSKSGAVGMLNSISFTTRVRFSD